MNDLIGEVAGLLISAGSPSPGPEARQLVAHVLGVELSQLIRIDGVTAEDREEILRLAARRAAGEPLQHITGRAYFRYESLEVGPGVFIPRPETEEMVGWLLTTLAQRPATSRRVVELCAGSGAITAALAREIGGVELHAVELSPDAFAYLERNLDHVAVDLRLGDMAEAFRDLDGTVDAVIANPPYIPTSHRAFLPDDVVAHDPELALFSGDDGLDATRTVAQVARRLLVPGGVLASEHDDSHPDAAMEVLTQAGFVDVASHDDLTSRPRYVTGVQPSTSGRMDA
ncbi:MAG TPA: peptide chain release factor N(5)-glutamine methyltransferase [Tessaracoccus flavescens]|uniref:peptide chain release factor N(5)-glutamine methyltransferase n=1 Tax=Tessaracoccus flavescens TaxID=399497 RepID=A0A921EPF2_9ACTN|nr:peptide chain release factor N(5)-glutamine methyltransferase [Tessaracoccus flavescens]